jgi:hypothetical protein
MDFFKTLFKYRLLPARFSGLLPYQYEVQISTFFGLSSMFDHIVPEFDAYLKKMGVTYRIKSRGYNFRFLTFWSKLDYEIFLDAASPAKCEIRIRNQKLLRSYMDEVLQELEIDHFVREGTYEFTYTIISSKRMVELMLRLDFETDRYGYRTLVTK